MRKRNLYLLGFVLIFSMSLRILSPTESPSTLRRQTSEQTPVQRLIAELSQYSPSKEEFEIIARANHKWEEAFNPEFVALDGELYALFRGSTKKGGNGDDNRTDIYCVKKGKEGWPDSHTLHIEPMLSADNEVYLLEDLGVEKAASSIEDLRARWGYLKHIDGEARFFPDPNGDTLGLFYIVFRNYVPAPQTSKNPKDGLAQIAMATIRKDDFRNQRWNKIERHGLLFPDAKFTDKDVNLFPEAVKIQRRDGVRGGTVTEEVYAFMHRPMLLHRELNIAVTIVPKDQGIGRGSLSPRYENFIRAGKPIAEGRQERYDRVGMDSLTKTEVGWLIKYHAVLILGTKEGIGGAEESEAIYLRYAEMRPLENILAPPIWESKNPVFVPGIPEYSWKLNRDKGRGSLFHGMGANPVIEGGGHTAGKNDTLLIPYGLGDQIAAERRIPLVAKGNRKGIIPEQDWDRMQQEDTLKRVISNAYTSFGIQRLNNGKPILKPFGKFRGLFNDAIISLKSTDGTRKVYALVRGALRSQKKIGAVDTTNIYLAVFKEDGITLEKFYETPVFTNGTEENSVEDLRLIKGREVGSKFIPDNNGDTLGIVYSSVRIVADAEFNFTVHPAFGTIKIDKFIKLADAGKTEDINANIKRWNRFMDRESDRDFIILPKPVHNNRHYAVIRRPARIQEDGSVLRQTVISFVNAADGITAPLKFVQYNGKIEHPLLPIRDNDWENKHNGGNLAIETEKGWLLIYHGVSEEANKYSAGAALLDLDYPEVVLARSEEPILEPLLSGETKGNVPNVAFVTGAILPEGKETAHENDRIVVHYSGADTRIFPAETSLRKLFPGKYSRLNANLQNSI